MKQKEVVGPQTLLFYLTIIDDVWHWAHEGDWFIVRGYAGGQFFILNSVATCQHQ